MSQKETIIAIVKDLILPIDTSTRYDVYFTNKRLAIIAMGGSDRIDYQKLKRRTAMGLMTGFVAPLAMYADDRRNNKTITDQQIQNITIDETVKLNEKNCFYTYDEIEKIRLSNKTGIKFKIISKEYESLFTPDEEQLEQLIEILPKIDQLKGKIVTYGFNLLNSDGFFCKFCGCKNDVDANYCKKCGKKMA